MAVDPENLKLEVLRFKHRLDKLVAELDAGDNKRAKEAAKDIETLLANADPAAWTMRQKADWNDNLYVIYELARPQVAEYKRRIHALNLSGASIKTLRSHLDATMAGQIEQQMGGWTPPGIRPSETPTAGWRST